jgi:hypothetical protein
MHHAGHKVTYVVKRSVHNSVKRSGNWAFDGIMGRTTSFAVRMFQKYKGLPMTGVVSNATRRALGLPAGRNLMSGSVGSDVMALQHALCKAGFWNHSACAMNAVMVKGMTETKQPMASKPMAKPMVKPSEEPMVEEPMEEATPAPMATPQAKPQAIAPQVEEPMVEQDDMEEMVCENLPTLSLRGGTWVVPSSGFWFVPGLGGQFNSNWASFIKYTWTGGADLWLGDLGIGGDVAMFNLNNQSFLLDPFTNVGSMMYDAMLKYRFDHGFYNVGAGWRGINQGTVSGTPITSNLNFGTLAFNVNRPLFGDHIWWNGKVQGGYNFSNANFYEGSLGTSLRFDPVALNVGFRHLVLNAQPSISTTINGPTAELQLNF